uniref:Uncharacterized protein n=1 Tax=Plectus sambesii TaxID=2011161 RepID=A0A914UW20_9BILA
MGLAQVVSFRLQQTLVDEQQRGNGQLASPQSSLLNGSVQSAVATNSAALLAAAVQQQQQQQSQMQHLLQLSGAAGLGNHLQNAYLQQQQLQLNDLVRGQLTALQERLQLNLVHQGQLVQQLQQCRDKKLIASLQVQIQQLSFEQQQLLQQIQVQQRHCLLQQPTVTTSSVSDAIDTQKIWETLLLSGAGGLGANNLLSGLHPSAAFLVAQTAQMGRPPLTDLTLSNLGFG